MTDAPETTCPYCNEDALAVAHFQGVASERARTQARIDALEAENARLRTEAAWALDYLSPPLDGEDPFIAREILAAALSKKDT